MKRTIIFSIWVILGFTFLQNVISQTITITPLSKTTYCGGEAISIPFTVAGTFTTGNTFTAQLSDASGIFSLNPYLIGTNTGITNGTISGIIPYYGITGSNILIRIVSTTPVFTSATIAITINARPEPAYFTVNPSSMSVCSGQTATFSNSIATPPSGYTASWDFPDATDDHSSAWHPNGARIWNLPSGTTTCQPKICKLTITQTSTGCQSDTTRTITICPIPEMTSANSKTICSGDFVEYPLTSNISTATFKWKALNNGNVNGESTTWIFSSTITDVLTLLTGVFSPEQVNYKVIPISNGCEGNEQTITITVFPTPAMPTLAVNPVEYCKNKISIPLTATGNNLQWYNNPSGGTAIPPPTPVTSAVNNFSYYVTQTALYFSPSFYSCESQRKKVDIIVNPLPVADFTFPSTINCANIPLQFTNTSTSGTTPNTLTYLWNFGDNSSGTNNSSAISNPIHDFSTAIGNLTQTFNVKLITTNIHGCSDEIIKTVTVNQIPDASLSDYVSSIPFTNCSPAGVSYLYNLEVTNTSSTFSSNTGYQIDWGNPSPTIENFTNTTFPINTSKTHTYPDLGPYSLIYTVNGSNGCYNTKTYPIFNGGNPSISMGNPGGTSACIPPNATYSFPITYTNILGQQNTPGTQYTISVNDNPNSVFTYIQPLTGSPPPNFTHTFTSSSCGTTSVSGSNTYPSSFMVNIVASNPCGSSSATIAPINISQNVQSDFIISPDTFGCVTPNIFTFTNNTIPPCFINPNYSINNIYKRNWTITPATGWSIISGSIGSTSPTFNPVTWGSDILKLSFYQHGNYVITFVAESNCSSDTITKTICVSPIPIPSFTLDQTSLCNPDIVNITNTTNEINFCSPFPTDLYTWDIICTNTNCDGSDCTLNGGFGFFAGGSNQHSKNPILQFNSPGVYKIKLTVKNGCSPVTSAEQTITVKDKPFIQTLTLSPTAPYCLGDNICVNTVVKDCYGTIASSYNWTSTLGNFPNPNQLNPGCITASSLNNQSITLNATNECGTTTKTESFNITQLCNNNPITGDYNICHGQVSNTYSIQGIPNATTYNWSLIPQNAGNITGTDTSVTIIWNPSFNGTATLSVYGSNGVSNSNTSILNVNIKALPTVNPIPDQSICNYSPTSPIIFTGSCSGATYYWVTTSTQYITGIPLSGVGNILPFTAINTSPFPIVLSITVTPFCNGCTGTPYIFTITVYNTPIINPIQNLTQSIQTLCNGDTTAAINFTGTGTIYNWTNSNPSIGLAANDTGNIPSFTATNSGTTPNIGIITITPYTQFCSGFPITDTIIVNPTPNAVQPTDLVFCNGDLTSLISFTGTGTSYNWTNNNTSIGLAANGTGDIVSFTAANTGTTLVVATITVTPKYTFGGKTCSGTPKIFTITVNPTPTVDQPSDLIYCNGDATSIINFTGTGTSYDWSNNNISIGLAANGTGDIVSFTATNTGSTPVVATITVTPKYTFGGKTCSGTPKIFTITVNPTPIINQPTNLVFCNGDLTSLISFTGTGTSYVWTNNNTSIGLAANGTGIISSFISTNTGVTPIMATITVTPKYTNGSVTCFGTSKTFTITINPFPISAGTISGLTNVCQGDSNVNYTVSTITNATSYLWTLPNGANGTSSSNSISVNYGASASTGVITVKGTNSCGDGSQSNLAVAVNPLPASASSITGVTSVCQGESNVNYTVSTITNATSYLWTLPNGANGTSSSNSISVNYGISAVSGNITVKGVNSCGEGGFSSLAVTVNQKPQTPVITQNGDSLISDALLGNQWYSLSNGIINNATSEFYLPQQNGDYFTIVTLNACSSDTSNIIYFDNTGILFNSLQTLNIKVIPNPFKDKTTLVYTLQDNMHIRISILDVTGKELKILCDKKQQKGEYNLIFNADSFSKGIYFYKIYADNEVFTGKLILIK